MDIVRKCIIFLFVLMLSSFNIETQEPGELDESFGQDGHATFAISGKNIMASDMKVQDDDKIVVIGSYFSPPHDLFILRFNEDGSMDNSFGSNGTVIYDFGYGEIGNCVNIQEDGKILIGGKLNGDARAMIVRLDQDGVLDESFSGEGFFAFEGNKIYDILDLTILPDGKIVIAGIKYNETRDNLDAVVGRLLENGESDLGFGNDGWVNLTIDEENTGFTSIAVQEDGKILAAGNTNFITWDETNDVLLARFNSDGSFDDNFAGTGYIVTGSDTDGEYIEDICLDNDDKILIAGSIFNTSYGLDAIVYRFLQNGDFDPDFNGGLATYDFDQDEYIKSIYLQDDGKILLGGDNYMNKFELIRINPDASLDLDFGTEGLVDFHIGDNINAMYSVQMQSNLRIITAGFCNDEGSYEDYIGASRFYSGLFVGSADRQVNEKIIITPNPAQDCFYINSPKFAPGKEATLIVFDSKGKAMKSERIKMSNPPVQVNCSQLDNGIYLLNLRTGKENFNSKLIIHR